jgi:hypothetical protein
MLPENTNNKIIIHFHRIKTHHLLVFMADQIRMISRNWIGH